jgi:hypothetical protein
MSPMDPTGEAHHADNQRRFICLEQKVDANTVLTEKLAGDTADLLEMWKDAGVVFKWLRRIGVAVVGVSKVAVAIGSIYVAIKYWGNKP